MLFVTVDTGKGITTFTAENGDIVVEFGSGPLASKHTIGARDVKRIISLLEGPIKGCHISDGTIMIVKRFDKEDVVDLEINGHTRTMCPDYLLNIFKGLSIC